MNELYTFEGLCNRLNGLASAMLKWEEFTLRWMLNDHCPSPFSAIFRDLPGVNVTEEAGDWQDYQYCEGGARHCYYFLRTASTREQVRSAYQRLLGACRFQSALPATSQRAVAIHYRNFIKWEKSSIAHTVEAADWLTTRAAADRIIVAGDCGGSIASIAAQLRDRGHRVEALRGGEMRHDYDRTEHDLERFCGELLTLTTCRWAYSNAPSSTVLDASRALGNEVWTSGDVKSERVDNGCHLFSRFGFDLLTC